MDINIIPIAEKKIRQRNIPAGWIKETISNPDQVIEGHTKRTIAHKKYKNNEITVITSYLTSEIKRYRKTNKNENRI
ncbi:hypothetical protein BEH94_09370 [Candidatus Altiarchaeales archaeon WOR_SM1_SCG]|nr:hypothetical protein BEH94_09370 [Candidatus Altiarchaeales archaeon WOR_SM1_SCG]ODS40390.1 MAG: hypothetical protein A7315_08690 [Candidatus Altiarchaeales archaeon WOR_SM1_79]